MRDISPTLHELMRNVLASMPDAVLSHESAAFLYGLSDDEPSDLHVAVPHGSERHIMKGVVLHQSLVPERREYQGLPLLTPARTAVVYAASIRNPLDAAGVLYKAVHELGMDTQDLLRHAAMSPRGGRGAVARAARELAAGARSVPEGVIWTACLEIGLPMPELNVPLKAGQHTLFPDCHFRQHKVVVEVDGREYHTTPTQIRHDAERQRRLEALGLTVIRFPASHVLYRADHVMETIMLSLGEERPLHAWARRYMTALARAGVIELSSTRRYRRRTSQLRGAAAA